MSFMSNPFANTHIWIDADYNFYRKCESCGETKPVSSLSIHEITDEYWVHIRDEHPTDYEFYRKEINSE